MWQLHAACAARDPSISEAALELPQASNIHEEAVARGLWLRVEQRPLQLVPICAEGATPWLDPSTHPACVVLEKNYEKIRAEALRLLERSNEGGIWKQERADASVRGLAVLTGGGLIDGQQQQQPAPPRGLTAGSWQDVTFYMNGKKHEAHAELAPFTSQLLASTEGNMRRDSTSCVYGSAFLSLLAPGTRLRPHCGPTNIRLRAHLPLLVPEGDCMMRVGNDPPRKWVEGKVCLFDDSFEHEVWNSTDKPRLVLIVDLWHPKLDTDEKRLSTLDPFRAERYLKVLDPSCALERGDMPKASAAAASSTSAAGGSSSSSSSGSGGGSEDGVNLPTVNGSSPLIDLLIEKEERALGGPHGVQALLHCLDQPACPCPSRCPSASSKQGWRHQSLQILLSLLQSPLERPLLPSPHPSPLPLRRLSPLSQSPRLLKRSSHFLTRPSPSQSLYRASPSPCQFHCRGRRHPTLRPIASCVRYSSPSSKAALLPLRPPTTHPHPRHRHLPTSGHAMRRKTRRRRAMQGCHGALTPHASAH